MKIKKTRDPSLFGPISVVAGILVVFLLWLHHAVESPDLEIPFSNETKLPDSTLLFLKKEITFFELIDIFHKEDIFLSVKDEASFKMPPEVKTYLETLGGKKIKKFGFRDSYAAVISDGKMIQEVWSKDKPVKVAFRGLSVESAGKLSGNFSKATIAGTTYPAAFRGLQVYILQGAHGKVLTYGFDFFDEENPTSAGSIVGEMAEFPNLPAMEIILSDKNFQKLAAKRQEALRLGILLNEEEDFVPAKIAYKGKTLKAEIRLKGDFTDHLTTEKWSFRVKLRNGKSLLGMNKFSLHHPMTRNYCGEWLFHHLLKTEGILNLQYHFLPVELHIKKNGNTQIKKSGLYALEESFDKNLLERNRRKEGVIIKINENPMWEERARFFSNGLKWEDLGLSGIVEFEELNILPFSEKKVIRDSVHLRQYALAKELYSAYLNGEVTVSEAFDLKLLAKYNAICNILGANHALIAHNYRLYYNPITSKLEPVGFDGNALAKVNEFTIFFGAERDLDYMEAYVNALEKVTSDAYLMKILNIPGLKEQIDLLQKEFPQYRFNQKALANNRFLLRNEIYPAKSLHVFLETMNAKKLGVQVENFGKLPVEIVGLRNQNGRRFGRLFQRLILPAGTRQLVTFQLEKNFGSLFVNKKKKKPGFEFEKDIFDIKVVFHTLGAKKELTENILPWKEREKEWADNDLLRKHPSSPDFEFLKINEAIKTITALPGNWQLNTELIIPKGYRFEAGPGFKLDLRNAASKIISFSPVFWEGTEENPVEITSKNARGQGVLVMETKDTSLLNHCKFVNLTSPKNKGWVLSGAVTFYDAPVAIKNALFSKSRSEDALNIVKTWFEMDNVVFTKTASDAFDGDFVFGSIKNSFFGDLGNDAIDVAGSDLEVENVSILQAGDKGLSAGESSKLKAENLKIFDSEIAVASKDQSEVIIRGIRLKNNNLGFTAFQKKPEFGPSKIDANGVELMNNGTNYLIENQSFMTSNGRLIETVPGVKEKMYGVEYGKRSD